MPASNERVPNKALSGTELKQIILNQITATLDRDGMLSNNIAFGRVSFEVRVSMHLDNPMYPLHTIEVLSVPASKQQIVAKPELAAIELGPLVEPLSEDERMPSTELATQIASPNMARVSNGMPLQIQKRNLNTGQMETVEQKFVGDMPDPEEVGNITVQRDTAKEQRDKWKRRR